MMSLGKIGKSTWKRSFYKQSFPPSEHIRSRSPNLRPPHPTSNMTRSVYLLAFIASATVVSAYDLKLHNDQGCAHLAQLLQSCASWNHINTKTTCDANPACSWTGSTCTTKTIDATNDLIYSATGFRTTAQKSCYTDDAESSKTGWVVWQRTQYACGKGIPHSRTNPVVVRLLKTHLSPRTPRKTLPNHTSFISSLLPLLMRYADLLVKTRRHANPTRDASGAQIQTNTSIIAQMTEQPTPRQ